MILELATAELGNRIRRAFGLRGRITTAVDETAFLAVQVADLDRPPWRTEGLSWMARAETPALAGNQTYNDVGSTSPDAHLVTLDRVFISNQNAAAFSVHLQPSVAAPPPQNGVTSELTPPASGLAGAPVGCNGGNAVVVAGGPLRVIVPISTTLVIPDLNIVLQPGVNWRILTAANNLDLVTTFQGRFWPRQGV